MQVRSEMNRLIETASSKEFVKLRPMHTQRANTYYHFLFDVLMPLDAILRRTPTTTYFSLPDHGKFMP
jgi:hypothetical protein